MSRHKYWRSIYNIVVGWDPPLDTYFAQVWADLEDEVPIWQIGQRRGEITTVQQLDLSLQDGGFGSIPSALCAQLAADEQKEGSQFDQKAPGIKRLLLALEEVMDDDQNSEPV